MTEEQKQHERELHRKRMERYRKRHPEQLRTYWRESKRRYRAQKKVEALQENNNETSYGV